MNCLLGSTELVIVVLVLRVRVNSPKRARSRAPGCGNRPQATSAAMHSILVVVFDNEAKAEEGETQLLQMDKDGTIGIYGYAVVAKKKDGTVVVKQADGHGSLSPFAESLLGRLSDSIHPISHWTAPKSSDSAAESSKTRSDINEMVEVLLPNRVAIVADVEEEWPPVLDARMDSIGGAVFRWSVSEVQHALDM